MIDRDLVGREQICLINDSFQNRKQYNIPKAQLVIADIPYNVGANAYGSNPQWYVDGDIKNGESNLAGKQFFDTDKNFNLNEFFHFCSKLLKPEPKETNKAGCLITFSAFEQQPELIKLADVQVLIDQFLFAELDIKEKVAFIKEAKVSRQIRRIAGE